MTTSRQDLLTTPLHLNHVTAGSGQIKEVSVVPGLKFIPRFLTPKEQAFCVERIDAAQEEWRDDLQRRVQHYGWRYDYKARAITPDMHLGALPEWLQKLAEKLHRETAAFDQVPEQVIVNEYLPGQGIGTHIDHPGFGRAVCTISLLDDWEMDFSRNWRDKEPALLERGSCVLLTGPARSHWQHGIQAKHSDPTSEGAKQRSRRLSLTFRTVLNQDGPND